METRGVGEVSFLMRRLEPRLALAITACAAWAAILLAPGDGAPLAISLYAAGIGFWCHRFPAHRQWLMAVRAVLLLEGAFVLLMLPGGSGPTGHFFFGPVVVVAAYSLALARPWAIALAAIALLQFGLACAPVPVTEWPLALAEAGLLCFFPAIGMQFGSALRELDGQVEQSLRDRGSRLYNEHGFFAHGAKLFHECRRQRRPFSLVMLSGTDLREVSDLMGRNATNQLVARLATELSAATSRDGIAARMDASEFALALPGVTPERARALLRQHLGEPPQIALKCRGDLVTVMLDVLVAESTPDIPSLEDFYDRMRANVLKRSGIELPAVPEKPSILRGMLQDDPPVPRHDRPTVPMGLMSPRTRRRLSV